MTPFNLVCLIIFIIFCFIIFICVYILIFNEIMKDKTEEELKEIYENAGKYYANELNRFR